MRNRILKTFPLLVMLLLPGCASLEDQKNYETRVVRIATPFDYGAGRCVHAPSVFNCVEYVRNYDGDTITFNIHDVHPLIGYHVGVRVNGIDTAEIKGKTKCEKDKALMAKELVRVGLQNAETITLKNVSRGKYFRIVADVYADGISVADQLLIGGLAYPYHGGKKKKIDWCKNTQ